MPPIWTPQSREVYRHWIESITTEASDKLTSWETSFVNDMERILDFRVNLTEAQATKLEDIYVKYTS